MNVYSAVIIIMLAGGSSFDLQSFTKHEMKIYKRSQTEKILPPTSEPKYFQDRIFDEWSSIIKKHTNDNLYRQFHKKK